MRAASIAPLVAVLFAAAAFAKGAYFWPSETLRKTDPAFPVGVVELWNKFKPERYNTAASYWCFSRDDQNGPGVRTDVSYCLCHDGEGCAVLKEDGLCEAPMGTVANGKVVACRQREPSAQGAS